MKWTNKPAKVNSLTDVYKKNLKIGIRSSSEFEKKLLATHGVNVGLKCGHSCYYCFTPSLIRTHYAFKEIGRSPYENNYSIVDPESVSRISKDVKKVDKNDTVMLCTYSDAWAPESKKYNLGRKILETLLEKSDSKVRALTKNAEIRKDYDIIKKYPDRVMVGFSITAPSYKNAARILEPYASTNRERISALLEAHKNGLRTYAMFCPIIPGMASSKTDLEKMFSSVLPAEPEDIWLEPVNARGPVLKKTSDVLRKNGYTGMAKRVDNIRHRRHWSQYAIALVQNALDIAEEFNVLSKLHILLYAKPFGEKAVNSLKKIDKNENIVWL